MTRLVVVADDDTLTRVIASRILRHAGYAVAAVAGAHEVRQIALHAEPAALLLDVLLGGYDASTLVPLLRAAPDAHTRALPHAPALLAELKRLGVPAGGHP